MLVFTVLGIEVFLRMSALYVLQNQHGYFLAKNPTNGIDWLDGRAANHLFATIHKDEAVNVLFEVNSHDITLRISVKEYAINSKKQPAIPENDLPPPQVVLAEQDTLEEGIPCPA